MDKFEYLPQLIVAYDTKSDDEIANLIHIRNANKENKYYCPCCGHQVIPKQGEINQFHYAHKAGENCSLESQMHWFVKNWLFESGSEFYIEHDKFSVKSIEIEQMLNTPFGGYKPDIIVHTEQGQDIFFEIFFTNRKRGEDYFCKWSYLKCPVVEVDIRQYQVKTSTSDELRFTYLYKDEKCYSKEYISKDLYANTIAKRKAQLTRQELLNYKSRIEQLDWFWQMIVNNNESEEILAAISCMEYEDQVFCYEIVKKKQCVKYLKDDIKEIINRQVLNNIKKQIDLPNDGDVYFDLYHWGGRTYEAGIVLNITTELITYNQIYFHCGNWCEYWQDKTNLNNYTGFPKIVFKSNIYNETGVIFNQEEKNKIYQVYNDTKKFKNKVIGFVNELLSHKEYEFRIYQNYIKVYKIIDKMKKSILECQHNFDIIHVMDQIQNTEKEIKFKEDFIRYIHSENIKKAIKFFEEENNVKICLVDLTKCCAPFGTFFCDYINENDNTKRWHISYTLKEMNINNLFNQIKYQFEKYEKAKNTCEILVNIINSYNTCFQAEYYGLNEYPEIRIKLINLIDKKEICFDCLKITEIITVDDAKKQLTEIFKKLLWTSEYKYGIRFMEAQ